MARKNYPEHPVRDAFVAELNAFYTDCGRPKYINIVEMSVRLKEIYSDPHGLESLPTFSKSALSETLNRRRKGLPDSAWVACFVLCCQRLAFEAGSIPTDPGRSSLPGWQKRLREAEIEAQRRGLPYRHGPRASGDAPGTEAPGPPTEAAVMFGSVPSPRQPDDTTDGSCAVTGPFRLTDAQRERLAEYGPYGQTLLVRAHAGDPHAVYQVGVMLAADPARSHDAVSQLTAAAAIGHPRALELLQASPGNLDRWLTATHAHDLARLAQKTGFPEAALAFYECVARFGSGNLVPGPPAPAPADDKTAL